MNIQTSYLTGSAQRKRNNKKGVPAFGASLITTPERFIFPILDYYKTQGITVDKPRTISVIKKTADRFERRNAHLRGKLRLTAQDNDIVKLDYQTADKKIISGITQQGQKKPVFMKIRDFFSPDTDMILDGHLGRFINEEGENRLTYIPMPELKTTEDRISHSQVIPKQSPPSFTERITNSVMFTLEGLGLISKAGK